LLRKSDHKQQLLPAIADDQVDWLAGCRERPG
jgi:hypothetical protein